MAAIDYRDESPITVNKDFNNVFFSVTKGLYLDTIGVRSNLFSGIRFNSVLNMISNLNSKLLLNNASSHSAQSNFIKILLKFKNKISLVTRYIRLSLFFFKKINRKLFKNIRKTESYSSQIKYISTSKGKSKFKNFYSSKSLLKYFMRIRKKTHFTNATIMDITTSKNNKLLLKYKKFLCKNLSKIPNNTFSDLDFIDFKFLANRALSNHIDTSKVYNLYSGNSDNIKQNHSTLNNSIFKNFSETFNYTNSQMLILFLSNPFFLKVIYNVSSYHKKYYEKNNVVILKKLFGIFVNKLLNLSNLEKKLMGSNIIPNKNFSYVINKRISSAVSNKSLKENFVPWYYHTIIRFIENCSGKKTIFQFYPFLNQEIDMDFMVRYQLWIPRMSFYQRLLGHRFFLEEALHIMHLSFTLRDPKILCI